MRHIEVVAGEFAVLVDNKVIGVVTKVNETQWSFHPLVPGSAYGVNSYLPLNHALEAGMKFQIT